MWGGFGQPHRLEEDGSGCRAGVWGSVMGCYGVWGQPEVMGWGHCEVCDGDPAPAMGFVGYVGCELCCGACGMLDMVL